MAEKKIAEKIVKAPIAKKTVKKAAAKTTAKTIKQPIKMKVQTAEGWNRSKLKELGREKKKVAKKK